MERKVQILSIKKNEIVLRKRKNKVRIIAPLLIIFLFVFSFASNNLFSSSLKSNILKVYNPVSSLYNDNSEAVFTNGGLSEKDSVSFTLPIKGASYEILSDGTIEFVVGNSILIMACESGKVDKVGVSLDGYKYIQLSHKNGIKSIVSNVEIIGVKEGDIVKSGQDIATSTEGSIVKLALYQNDSQISNIKISKSKIVWES